MSTTPLNVFVPITKVDAVQRLVYGSLASETVDKSNEVFDYESSKPLVEAWSGEIAKNTDGKSVGNLRAMHGKIAAGKFTELACNDKTKSVDVCAKVVDDGEWNKVTEGVYTGFSIGGSYVKKWKDGDVTRYTAKPSEGSLVDLPCNPGSTFLMVKDGGVEELRKFVVPASEPVQRWVAEDGQLFEKKAEAEAHNTALAKSAAEAKEPANALAASLAALTESVTKAEAAVKATETPAEPAAAAAATTPATSTPATPAVAKRDFTDDERKAAAASGEAMGDGSYPIQSKSDLQNAIQSFRRAKNKAAVKAHILQRAKALNADDMLPDAWKPGADKAVKAEYLRKGLAEVARFACLLQELEWLQQSTEWEAESEKDNSTLPANLKEDIANLCATLRSMVEEETNELLDDEEVYELGELLEMSARATLVKLDKGAALLAKAGMRHGKEDQANLDAAHDHLGKAMGIGDKCDALMPAAKAAADNAMAHMAHAHNLTKAAGAKCPGGGAECAQEPAEKAAGSATDHLQAAHDHLSKMGLGKCMGMADKVAKAGARHSAADMDALTKAHDAAVEAGAKCQAADGDCAMGKAEEEEPTEKLAASADLTKALDDERAKTARLEKSIAESTTAVNLLADRVQKLESLPIAHPRDRVQGPYRVFDKSEDDAREATAQLTEIAKTDPNSIAEAMFKLVHKNPHRVG